MTQGSVLKAALLGGILAGVVSSLPLISMLCCVWVVGGGVFAAWTLGSDSGGRASLGRRALAGFFSGILAGAICAPLSAVVNRLVQGTEFIESQVEQAIGMVGSSGGALSAEDMESLARGAAFLELNVGSVAAVLGTAFIFSFFGLLGGLLGGALIGRREKAAQAGKPPAFPASPPSASGASPASPVPEDRGELSPDELPELPRSEDEPKD